VFEDFVKLKHPKITNKQKVPRTQRLQCRTACFPDVGLLEIKKYTNSKKQLVLVV
jgi:hypothetical protein